MDGVLEARACGPSGAGMQLWRCVAGLWMAGGPCSEPGGCEEGEVERRPCGPDGHGTETRLCLDGCFTPWGACVAPEMCVETPDPADPECPM